LAAVLGCVALVTGVPSRASAAALVSAVWTASKTTPGSTGVTYTYTVVPRTTATLSQVTMTVPAGTSSGAGANALAAGTVTPLITPGGTAVLSGNTLSYSFTPVTVAAGVALSIQFTGLTNSPATGSQTSAVTTLNSGITVDNGTASFTFTGVLTALSGVTWTTSSAAVGATSVSYSYTFTPANLFDALAIGTVKITVPPGTTGTPVIISASPVLNMFTGVTLSGNTLTITGNGGLLSILGPISVTIGGLSNTFTAGSYVPEIVTSNTSGNIDSGVATGVNFPGGLGFGAPAALSWSGTLNGQNQYLIATSPADQLLTVNDQSDTGAGWRVTVSATNFVTASGATLPVNGVLGVSGSTSGLWTSTTGPTAACLAAVFCTLPNDGSVTYPVLITSAATSPAPAVVYDAAAATGVGPVTVGGSTAANPVGWWLNVPAVATAGTYTSTVTVSLISGP
jgi:hypothetical protein